MNTLCYCEFTRIVFLLLFSTQVSSRRSSPVNDDDDGLWDEDLFSTEPDLFLTVSSEPDCPHRSWYKPWTWLTETKCDRRLELNWINFDKIFEERDVEQVEDYVGVFRWDPTSNASPQPPPLPLDDHRCPVRTRSEAASGYYKTTLRYERPSENGDLSPGGLKNPCFLGYWIAYIRMRKFNDGRMISNNNGSDSTIVLKSKCLRLYPFWMAELKEAIGDLPLTSLMIPGTHNSGSWERYKGLLQSEINPVTTYEITQEESIHDQLIHGIRYLDVRVTYHPFLPVKFWVSHDTLIPQIPLAKLLEDIQRFHEETNREEIVFVDFHRVTIHSAAAGEINRSEAKAKIHSELIQLVDKYLGRYLVPYNTHNTSSISTAAAMPFSSLYDITSYSAADLTPNLLWKWSRTVIVTYPDPAIRKQYSFIWPPFQHSWANTNNISVLEQYLEKDLQYFGCQGRFWTLMAELTATASDVVTKPHLGLRGMAQAVNGQVTKWFQRKEWYSRAPAVASDYFLGNNLIEIAIKVNANKGKAICNRKSI